MILKKGGGKNIMIIEYKIFLINAIITTSLFCLITGSIFIEGTNGIRYGHIKRTGEAARNETNKLGELLGFVTETGGFETHHHIENFLFASYFSSSIVHLPGYLGILITSLAINIYLYFVLILKQLSYAAMFEFLEKFIIFVFEILLIFFPILEPIRIYVTGGENCINTMLSDLPQAVFSTILLVLFIYFKLIRPISYRLYKKKWYIIILRLIIHIVSGLSSFLTYVKKKYSFIPFYINTGFYAHCALRIFLLNFLYLEDLIECKKTARNYEKEKREINTFYLMILGYLLVEWISTMDLMAYGYLTSNIVGFIYFIFWFVIKR